MSTDAARHHAAMALLTALVIAALVLGKPILVPLAAATIIAFILAPLVRHLGARGVPHPLSVVAVLGVTMSLIVALGFLLSVQLLSISSKVGDYKENFIAKVRSVSALGREDGAIKRTAAAFERLGDDISHEVQASGKTAAVDPAPQNSPVVVRDNGSRMTDSMRQAMAFLESLATVGLALLFTLFLLLQQNDMSDRIVRLLGTENLSGTSGAMTEAGTRLSKLFLTQAMINGAFGIIVGAGLWLIGLPGVLVWAIVAALSRFVPFIGAVIAAVPPIILAAGVVPGWGMVIATVALFAVCELVAAHVVEPLVLGRQVGLSPLAMVVAASFWTLVWGPVGLLLAAPMTMALVVLGRYMPGLAFLSVMLGDEPPLSQQQELYRRLLSRDALAAADQIETAIEKSSVSRACDEVVLPALNLAARDERAGRLSHEQVEFVRDSSGESVDLIEALDEDPKPGLTSVPVFIVPARGDIDVATSRLLAAVITVATGRPTAVPDQSRGLSALAGEHVTIDGQRPTSLVIATAGGVSPRHLQLMAERAAHRYPEARVFVITADQDDFRGSAVEAPRESRARRAANAAELIANLRPTATSDRETVTEATEAPRSEPDLATAGTVAHTA